MKIHARAPTLLATGLAALAGCAEGSTGPAPDGSVAHPAPIAHAVRVEGDRIALTAATTPGVSPGLRGAMTRTLADAASTLDLQPAASAGLLREFLRDVETRQGEHVPAPHDRPRTVRR